MSATALEGQYERTYEQFEAYTFEEDVDFQAGLPTLLTQDRGGIEVDDETRRSFIERVKWFYFQKKLDTVFDLDDYKAWRDKRQKNVPTTTNATPYSKSFQEVVELIQSGATIPGIRQIPNELAKDEPTQSTMKLPLKPWQKASADPEQVAPGKDRDLDVH